VIPGAWADRSLSQRFMERLTQPLNHHV